MELLIRLIFVDNSNSFFFSSVSYENWLEHTQNLKRQVENELSDTYTLRETMHVAKEKSKRDVEFQQDATNYALRRRSYASRKGRNELEWQKLKVIYYKLSIAFKWKN